MLIEEGIGEFSDAQAVTTSAASTNVLNIGLARHQYGADSLWLWVRVNVAALFVGTESYIFAFETDSEATFSTTPAAAVVVADTDGSAIVTADTESTPLKTAGKLVYCSTLPYNANQQFGRWYYTTANTAGITVDAALGPERPTEDRSKSQIYVSNVGNP